MTKLRLLISALAFVLALSLLSSTNKYIPTLITIDLEQWTSGGFSVYLDTGAGFNENESYRQPLTRNLSGEKTLYFILPGSTISKLRIDPGSHEGKVSIKNICLYGVPGSKCWSPQNILDEFKPGNDISQFIVFNNILQMNASGRDPYIVLEERLTLDRNSASAIKIWVVLFISIALSVIVFHIAPLFLQPRAELKRVIFWWQQYKFQITPYQISAMTILFSLVASGLWIELDVLGPGFNIALFVFLVILTYTQLDPGKTFIFVPANLGMSSHGLNPKMLAQGVFWGMIVAAPVFIYLGLTWSQEFPYIGDNQYHKSAFITSYHFWNKYGLLALIFIGTGMLSAMAGWLKAWMPLAFFFLFTSSYFGSLPFDFLRYPAVGRIPGNMLLWASAHHSQWETFFNILRTSNALAVVAWIFVLRPLFIKRWPGIAILPFAFLFFYQKEVVNYFTSGYLEPWALVFVLLAIELVITRQTLRANCIAYLLIGVAALIKEQMIFVLPFIWLASNPMKVGERMIKIICAIAAATPFIVYYLLRKDAEIGRGFSVASYEEIVNLERLLVFYDRLHFHFGYSGIVLILALAGFYVYLLYKPPVPRLIIFSLLSAFIFQVLFFYVDAGSVYYTGYPRFLLGAYLLLCASTLVLPKILKATKLDRRMTIVVAGILILQSIMLVPYFMLTQQPGPARNFTRHYENPVYLPIRDLIEQAEAHGTLSHGDAIYVSDPTAWDISSINSDYSSLGSKYRFKVGTESRCRCDAENPAVLESFIYFANLNKNLPEDLDQVSRYRQPPSRFYNRWQEINARRPQCIKEIESTCEKNYKTIVGEEVVGILGIR